MSGGVVNQASDVEMDAKNDDVRYAPEKKRPPPKDNRKILPGWPFIILIILLVLLILLLIIALATKGFGAWISKDEIPCDSPTCTQAAARLAEKMDPSAKPCDDFYQYACGGYQKNNVIPSFGVEKSVLLTDVPLEITNKIKNLLESKSELDQLNSVKQAKIYYKSCMDEAAIKKAGTKPLKDLVEANGGWGPLGTKWNAANFNLEDYLVQMDKLGRSLLQWAPQISYFNGTERLISINPGALTLSNPAVYENADVLAAYKKTLREVCKTLDADDKVAKAEIPKMLDFEVELAKIYPKPELPNTDHIITLEQVSKLLTGIDVMKVLNGGLAPHKMTKESRVMLHQQTYWQKFSDLLGKTDKRTIAAYILYKSAISPYIKYLDKATRELSQDLLLMIMGSTMDFPRYVTCIKAANTDLFQFPITRLYVEEYKSGDTEEITRMTDHLEKVFVKRLDDVDWLDDSTREKAKIKAENMLLKLGYPKEILDDAKLNENYKNADLKADDYFGNVLKMHSIRNAYVVRESQKRHDRSEWLSPPPLMVNAFYSASENAMILPMGILNPPVFDPKGPKYVNYGAMGKIIGHEITHGFDNTGQHFDKLGNMRPWMSKTSIDNFNKQAKCIEVQYSKITIEKLGVKIDGKKTLGENVADAGGIKQAFQAYQEWVDENGEEKRLPGLDLSNKQLFFVSYAQVYCQIINAESLKQKSQMGKHTPNRERVLGTLMNSEDFAKAFECPSGSKYNPEEKCTVW